MRHHIERRATFAAAILTFTLLAGGCETGEDTCFAAGTRIATPSGDRPIEDLMPGDEVLSFDPESQEIRRGEVTRVFAHEKRPYRELSLPTGLVVGITGNHPVYAANRGGFVPARALEGGDSLLTLAGGEAARASEASLATAFEGRKLRGTVYNISVAQYENYFAGGVLVHNKTLDASPPADAGPGADAADGASLR
jgi:filamentous hemagglutinin